MEMHEASEPKYLNGKVVCIKTCLPWWTVGKVYNVVNGVISDDDGTVDLNDIMRFPLTDVREVEHGKWILIDGNTGVCSNCYRQDHIDPLAKYCRYCGTRLEEPTLREKMKFDPNLWNGYGYTETGNEVSHDD